MADENINHWISLDNISSSQQARKRQNEISKSMKKET